MINKKKTFNLLLAAQSLGAFGDNAVYSVIMGILLEQVRQNKITLLEFGSSSAIYINCLFLPFIILAPFVGWLSDRYEKRTVLISANLIKALGCFIGLLGILIGKHLLIISYLIVGVGSAIYSPSKYGIIPELRNEEELVKGNAAIEMSTIFSILAGVLGGGILIDNIGAKNSFFVLFLVYAVASFINFLMDRSKIYNKNAFFSKSISDFNLSMKSIFKNKLLYIPVIGTAIFWSSASFVRLNLQTWGQNVVRLSTATQISMLALWLSIGIIIGSFIAGKIFKTGQIKQSWIFGFSMGFVILVMVLKYLYYGALIGELVVLGALGGLFLIPLNAIIQARSVQRNIGKVISIQNCFENTSMLLSSCFFWIFSRISISSDKTFFVIGGFLCLISILFLKPSLKKV